MQMMTTDSLATQPAENDASQGYVGAVGEQSCHTESSCCESDSQPKSCAAEALETKGQETIEMLGKLPAEVGMLLVISGIAGILLPGPVGTPLLIAGGVTIWPKTFQPIERWFSRRFPVVHREGVTQMKEFVASLQNRFPDAK